MRKNTKNKSYRITRTAYRRLRKAGQINLYDLISKKEKNDRL